MAKNVCDCRGTKGIVQAESDEQQRRWSEKQWKAKERNPNQNYDGTRCGLNFEVRNGKIQKIDSSKSIDEMIRQICKERNMRYPNDPCTTRRDNVDVSKIKERNVAAQFIFGGSRDRMHEIAFGSQKVDLKKGADNSGITRNRNIELWALDTYQFLARHYGEENIVSFYVHLDETNPHCHATVLPVAQIKGKNRISWNRVFGGKTRQEAASKYFAIHDDYYKEVGQKWGLDRGTPIAETGARHRSTREWHEQMMSDIKQAQRAIKGLSSMVANLEKQREELERQLAGLRDSAAGESDKISELRKQIAEIDGKLGDKKDKLATAEAQLQQLLESKDFIGERLDTLNQDLRRAGQEGTQLATDKVGTALLIDAISEFQKILPKLPPEVMSELDGSTLKDVTENGLSVLMIGALLYMGFMDSANSLAHKSGGGGSSENDLSWGRRPDEDDKFWARRCAQMARGMMKPEGIRRGRR